MPKEDKPATGTPDDEPDDEKDKQIAHWKDMARKNEDRAKANAKAAERLAELEASQKSDSEKFEERLSAAEKRAEEAERRALRSDFARDNKLTSDQAEMLGGANAEELSESLERMKKAFPKQFDESNDDSTGKPDGSKPSSNGPPSRKPKPELRGGTDPTEEPTVDAAKALEAIPRL